MEGCSFPPILAGSNVPGTLPVVCCTGASISASVLAHASISRLAMQGCPQPARSTHVGLSPLVGAGQQATPNCKCIARAQTHGCVEQAAAR